MVHKSATPTHASLYVCVSKLVKSSLFLPQSEPQQERHSEAAGCNSAGGEEGGGGGHEEDQGGQQSPFNYRRRRQYQLWYILYIRVAFK